VSSNAIWALSDYLGPWAKLSGQPQEVRAGLWSSQSTPGDVLPTTEMALAH
jgi:hypothetical protein